MAHREGQYGLVSRPMPEAEPALRSRGHGKPMVYVRLVGPGQGFLRLRHHRSATISGATLDRCAYFCRAPPRPSAATTPRVANALDDVAHADSSAGGGQRLAWCGHPTLERRR